MESNAVLEIVHLRLHPASSSSFALARRATPDLPPAFLDTWRQICTSASVAGGHPFRLSRSTNDPGDFYFIGGWDDPAVHAEIIARSRDSLLAASLGKWMKHISVRHIKSDVTVLDNVGERVGWRTVIREWEVKGDRNDLLESNEMWTKDTWMCTAGWDVSAEVQGKHEEFADMAKVLDNGREVFKLDRGRAEKVWVAVRFAADLSRDEEEPVVGGKPQVLEFVLGAFSDQVNESHSLMTEEMRLESLGKSEHGKPSIGLPKDAEYLPYS